MISMLMLLLLLFSAVRTGRFEGRQILGPTPQEQHGRQEITRRPPSQREPDRHEGRFPGEGGSECLLPSFSSQLYP